MQATYILQRGVTLSASAGFGIIITTGLFILMYSLIAMKSPIIEDVKYDKFNVVMDPREKIEDRRKEITEKPIDPQPQPGMPEIKQNFDNPGEFAVAIVAPTNIEGLKIDPVSGSGTAMPFYQVAPRYPRRAVARGIEGFVDLVFDISPTGKTENIRVIYAQPKGSFENESKRTLARWKYKPAMDDGVAQAQKNQKTRITFKLDK